MTIKKKKYHLFAYTTHIIRKFVQEYTKPTPIIINTKYSQYIKKRNLTKGTRNTNRSKVGDGVHMKVSVEKKVSREQWGRFYVNIKQENKTRNAMQLKDLCFFQKKKLKDLYTFLY